MKHPATDGRCSLFDLLHWFFQSDAGWEEYYDYIFPEDAANQPNLKLLAMAKMWKRQQLKENDDDEVPEKTPAEETMAAPMEASSDEPTVPSENDRNTASDKEQETYDDRDDDDDGSSSDSSDSHDEDGEKPEKQGRDEEEG